MLSYLLHDCRKGSFETTNVENCDQSVYKHLANQEFADCS